MKKMLLMSTFVLITSSIVTSCKKDADDLFSNGDGIWNISGIKSYSIISSDTNLLANDSKSEFILGILQFNDDNTYTSSIDGNSDKGKWNRTNTTISIDSDTSEIKVFNVTTFNEKSHQLVFETSELKTDATLGVNYTKNTKIVYHLEK